jgi:hypothetical protein
MELYTHEDLIFLSSWEVYNLTSDISDFVDTLFAIERFEFFANRITTLDDPDESPQLDDQLKTLYQYKESVPNNIFSTLTKLVKSGDYYLIGQFSNHSQGIIDHKKFEAIL